MSTGKVRILPFDTPGVPPSLPYIHDGQAMGYFIRDACLAELHAAAVPPEDRPECGGGTDDGWWCTRPPHDPDEIHVCHLRHADTHEPVALIVWGGE